MPVKAVAIAAISTHTSRFAADVRAICVLAAPLIGNNLSIIGMQFADTVMAGQLGARDLAALCGRRRLTTICSC